MSFAIDLLQSGRIAMGIPVESNPEQRYDFAEERRLNRLSNEGRASG
jgi:hypothetical protein